MDRLEYMFACSDATYEGLTLQQTVQTKARVIHETLCNLQAACEELRTQGLTASWQKSFNEDNEMFHYLKLKMEDLFDKNDRQIADIAMEGFFQEGLNLLIQAVKWLWQQLKNAWQWITKNINKAMANTTYGKLKAASDAVVTFSLRHGINIFPNNKYFVPGIPTGPDLLQRLVIVTDVTDALIGAVKASGKLESPTAAAGFEKAFEGVVSKYKNINTTNPVVTYSGGNLKFQFPINAGNTDLVVAKYYDGDLIKQINDGYLRLNDKGEEIRKVLDMARDKAERLGRDLETAQKSGNTDNYTMDFTRDKIDMLSQINANCVTISLNIVAIGVILEKITKGIEDMLTDLSYKSGSNEKILVTTTIK